MIDVPVRYFDCRNDSFHDYPLMYLHVNKMEQKVNDVFFALQDFLLTGHQVVVLTEENSEMASVYCTFEKSTSLSAN